MLIPNPQSPIPQFTPFDWSALGTTPPTALASARTLAHHAAQWPSKAARANLDPRPDDSHASLEWNAAHGALLCEPLPTAAGDVRLGVRIASLELLILRDATLLDNYALEGKTHTVTAVWLDSALRALGLKPASMVQLPYTTPRLTEARRALNARSQHAPALEELARWLDAAAGVLVEFKASHARFQPGPEHVRCWPHHFDIATLVKLEEGAAETARSIGVGLSAGDASYPQPYFYVGPWPRFDPSQLPEAPAPWRWHTEGFVAVVLTGEDALALPDRGPALAASIDAVFDICRMRMGPA